MYQKPIIGPHLGIVIESESNTILSSIILSFFFSQISQSFYFILQHTSSKKTDGPKQFYNPCKIMGISINFKDNPV